jgi:hypothetical protein
VELIVLLASDAPSRALGVRWLGAMLMIALAGLFALVLLTMVRRMMRQSAARRTTAARPSAWEAAGKRARPEGGDAYLPSTLLGGDGGGKSGKRGDDGGSPRHDPDSNSNDGDAGGGGGGGGGGDGGGD